MSLSIDRHRPYLGSQATRDVYWGARFPHDDLETLLMSPETFEFLLLLSGWIVAFLLGRELQTGFRQWKMRTVEARSRRDD
jgi:hypothetical protein